MNIKNILLLAFVLLAITGCQTAPSNEQRQAASSLPATPEKPTELAIPLPNGQKVVYGQIFGDYDMYPIPLLQAVAKYPEQLRIQGVTGQATVTFTLAENSETKDFTVTATRAEFGEAALTAAKKNKYKVATKAKRPVECRIELLYTFPGAWIVD